jgi:hypothetical protein
VGVGLLFEWYIVVERGVSFESVMVGAGRNFLFGLNDEHKK